VPKASALRSEASRFRVANRRDFFRSGEHAALLRTFSKNMWARWPWHRISPGGGVALLRATAALAKLKPGNDDQRYGVDAVKRALSWPARQIAENAGEDGSLIVGKILENKEYAWGFEAQSGEYANLFAKGIIDPTKVVRSALQDAASIAALLITTEAMVAEAPKKKMEPAKASLLVPARWIFDPERPLYLRRYPSSHRSIDRA
jgi:chaperonin GroEL